MTATRNEATEDFEPVYHHYGPHRAGLPPLIPYFRELWHRRGFAIEMSRANMRGANVTTFFGQAWMILNPLLLALIYYLLVTIIRQRADPLYFAHLTLNLFLFTLMNSAVSTGTTSVVRSGRLLINTAFPRLLIPLSAMRTSLYQFLPTIPVYLVIHAIFLTTQWHPRMLLSFYFIAHHAGVLRRPGGPVRHLPDLLPRHQELPAVPAADLDVSVTGALDAVDAGLTAGWSSA